MDNFGTTAKSVIWVSIGRIFCGEENLWTVNFPWEILRWGWGLTLFLYEIPFISLIYLCSLNFACGDVPGECLFPEAHLMGYKIKGWEVLYPISLFIESHSNCLSVSRLLVFIRCSLFFKFIQDKFV